MKREMEAYLVLLHLVSRGWATLPDIKKILGWKEHGFRQGHATKILAHINHKLIQLSEEWGELIPRINAFIFYKDGTCTDYIRDNIFEGKQPSPAKLRNMPKRLPLMKTGRRSSKHFGTMLFNLSPTNGSSGSTKTQTRRTDKHTGDFTLKNRRTFDEVSYEELDPELLEEYVIYFHKLPAGNVIKIGISKIANGNYHKRIKEAQRYFVEDVECLGIELCASKEEAKNQETQLKRAFGLARPKSELIHDTAEVRAYIQKNCSVDVDYITEMSHIAELKRNRSR